MIAQPGEYTKNQRTVHLKGSSCPTTYQFTKPAWITYSKPAASMPFIVWVTGLNINCQDIQKTSYEFLSSFWNLKSMQNLVSCQMLLSELKSVALAMSLEFSRRGINMLIGRTQLRWWLIPAETLHIQGSHLNLKQDMEMVQCLLQHQGTKSSRKESWGIQGVSMAPGAPLNFQVTGRQDK